jgi:hypothetical protein
VGSACGSASHAAGLPLTFAVQIIDTDPFFGKALSLNHMGFFIFLSGATTSRSIKSFYDFILALSVNLFAMTNC